MSLHSITAQPSDCCLRFIWQAPTHTFLHPPPLQKKAYTQTHTLTKGTNSMEKESGRSGWTSMCVCVCAGVCVCLRVRVCVLACSPGAFVCVWIRGCVCLHVHMLTHCLFICIGLLDMQQLTGVGFQKPGARWCVLHGLSMACVRAVLETLKVLYIHSNVIGHVLDLAGSVLCWKMPVYTLASAPTYIVPCPMSQMAAFPSLESCTCVLSKVIVSCPHATRP